MTVLALDTPESRKIIRQLAKLGDFRTVWGDLTDYASVREAVREVDVILHLAALVSPAADLKPALAMKINWGGTRNLLQAIRESQRADEVYFVNIGTVAETGDRLPPIHWGRVGDPVKPSYFDYYAVAKTAAEREVIESGLTHWVSLRQTGIIGPAMTRIFEPIILHNPLNNVLEYVSDRDSARLLRNLCIRLANGTLSSSFWEHIYNIGGGQSCRANSLTLYEGVFSRVGVSDLADAINPRWFATRNFHGQYYLDSDKLENLLHFRQDSLDYFYDSYERTLGPSVALGRTAAKFPGGESLVKQIIRQRLKHIAKKPLGTLHALETHDADQIAAFWGSYEAWQKLPDSLEKFLQSVELPQNVELPQKVELTQQNPVHIDHDGPVHIDHGYDESKPESALTLADVKGAAQFRGGECLSETMETGDWRSKLHFRCAFGHEFAASPRLVLEGGHWCPQCEDESWNYSARALVDPFFAQVWWPLHSPDEPMPEVKKLVSPRSERSDASADCTVSTTSAACT